jgi:hypothetical protein
MAFRKMVLKTFAMSTYNTTQLGCMSKVTWTPWTTTSRPPLTITLNWQGDKWVEKMSWNYKHKVLFTNWYMTSPITITRRIRSIPTHSFATCVQINHFCHYQYDYPPSHMVKNLLVIYLTTKWFNVTYATTTCN